MWKDDPVNGVIVVASVIIGIIVLPNLFRVAKYVFGALLRCRETASLAASVSHSRERNLLFLVSLLPVSLLMSRYELYHISLMDGQEPWVVSLMCLGALSLALLLRYVLVNNFAPRRMGDAWKIARTNILNFFIIAAAAGLLIAGIASFTNLDDSLVRKVLLSVFSVLFAVIIYRNFEILSWKGQRFKAFLYLCGLELTPAVLLVVSAIIF